MARKKKKMDEDIKRLVIARLRLLSSDQRICVESVGIFTKEEMIKRVENDDPVGEKIAEVHLNYLQSLKKGIFYEQQLADC